jgi:hypothetical protein
VRFDAPLLQGKLYWRCRWRVATLGQAIGQRPDPPLLTWSLGCFQQEHQTGVIAQQGRQDLQHDRSRRLCDPVGGAERYQQAFVMKFVKIKFLLGKRFCRQQGASHARILHISSRLPAARAGEALL